MLTGFFKIAYDTKMMTPIPSFREVFLLSLVIFSYVQGYYDENFQSAMQEFTSKNYTSDEINDWWQAKKAKMSKVQNAIPRVFPLCFHRKEPEPNPTLDPHDTSMLNCFSKILDDLKSNDLREFNATEHAWKDGMVGSDFDEIESIVGLRVYLNDAVELPTDLKMRQWINIRIKFKEFKTRGLLVQAITAPLGVPGGEFMVDRKCDGDGITVNVDQFVIPCTYYPRAAVVVPNVYGICDTGETESIQFRFRWFQAQCLETTAFQFIIIYTEDMTNYKIFLTPVYRFNALDSQDALPTPNYHGYQDVASCNNGLAAATWDSFPDFPIEVLPDTRIFPNYEYDECARTGLDGTRYGTHENFSCPPGPFECVTHWNNSEEWKEFADYAWARMNNRDQNDCCEMMPVTGTTTTLKYNDATEPDDEYEDNSGDAREFSTVSSLETTTLTSVLENEQKLISRAKSLEAEQKISHGELCIFVWLVLIPVSDHIARYYKDFPNFENIGLGFWIIAHVVIHSLGLVFTWLSFGLVVGLGYTDEDKISSLKAIHFLFGTVSMICFHMGFVTGLIRPHNERKAFKFVLAHSLGGYFVSFLSFLCIWVSHASRERLYICVALLLIRILAITVSFFVELKQDQILDIGWHRPRFPVLQRIAMEENPPLCKIKIGVLILMGTLNLTLYVVMKIFFGYDPHKAHAGELEKKS